jgi:murein tripeptide amidase MpaA
MKSTGFAGSSGEQSIMDSVLADYGTKSAEAYGNMVSQAQAGQEKIDDIIRQNQNQAFQLRQMEQA